MPLFFWFLAQYETKIVGELQLESKPTYRSPYYGLLWIVLQVFTFPNDFPNGWQSFTSFEKLGQFKRWHFYPNNYWHSGISIALWGSCFQYLNTSFSQPSESRKYFKEMQFVEVWGLWKQENINFHFSKTNFECVKRFVVPFRSRTQSS